METKPGWQSTEFLLTVATQVIALLVVLGVIGAGDRATIEGAVVRAVESAAALAGAAVVLWKYIRERLALKRKVVEANTAIVLEGKSAAPELVRADLLSKTGGT